MASAQVLLRDTRAILDPLPGRLRSERWTDGVSSFHLVGTSLLQAAERKGRGEPALAAVEVFRDAIDKCPHDPSLYNALGASLLAAAKFQPSAAAADSLSGAERAFQAASAEAEKQHAPRSAVLRYAINLAAVQWLRGERIEDHRLIEHGVATLSSIASELSHTSPYWAHVQDNIGNAQMALGRTTEAIRAYQTALARRQAPAERARSLNNLGTANAESGRLDEAYRCYRDALALQPKDELPLAWALTQHNLAIALLRRAVIGRRQMENERQLRSAIGAFEAALEVRERSRMPQDWAITTANLANASVALGTLLCLQKRRLALQAGLSCIRSGIDQYKTSLPELVTSDQQKTVRNLVTAWRVLAGVLGEQEAQAEIQAHRQDVLAFVVRHGNPALAKVMEARPDELAFARAGAPASRADPAQQAPPPGLQWPTETYAQAHMERKETIVPFLSRVWLPFIELGALDLRTLRARDPSAAKAIDNFQQGIDPATGQRRRLPPELDIPTKKTLNDRLAAAALSPGDRPARLDWALRSRARRKQTKEKA